MSEVNGSAWDTLSYPPDWYDGTDDSLPPDWTVGELERASRFPSCQAQWDSWLCTRTSTHRGRHAAGTGRHIVAEWSDADIN